MLLKVKVVLAYFKNIYFKYQKPPSKQKTKRVQQKLHRQAPSIHLKTKLLKHHPACLKHPQGLVLLSGCLVKQGEHTHPQDCTQVLGRDGKWWGGSKSRNIVQRLPGAFRGQVTRQNKVGHDEERESNVAGLPASFRGNQRFVGDRGHRMRKTKMALPVTSLPYISCFISTQLFS